MLADMAQTLRKHITGRRAQDADPRTGEELDVTAMGRLATE
jgi:hypothetical protein